MYSDIDASKQGTIYYRETKEKELLDRASAEVYRYFSDGQGFRAHSLFIATWLEVGPNEQQSSLVGHAIN